MPPRWQFAHYFESSKCFVAAKDINRCEPAHSWIHAHASACNSEYAGSHVPTSACIIEYTNSHAYASACDIKYAGSHAHVSACELAYASSHADELDSILNQEALAVGTHLATGEVVCARTAGFHVAL